jgi:hypothetical protein
VRLDDAAVAGLPDRVADLVRGMAINRRGLIEAGRLEDRVALVAAAARAFPEARIAVTSASRSAAVAFVDRLRPRLDEPVALFHKDGYVLSPVRIQVCTWGSLDERGSDIIVYADARDAISARYLRSISLIEDQHVYGFVRPDRRLHARDQLGLEALFGPVIYRDRSTAAVGVIFARVPEIAIRGKVVGLERKRRAVWHNERRNAVVAGVAEALATGDAEDLGRHGLAFDEPAAVVEVDKRGPRMTIVVESPEHGRELARRLPGWSLLDATRPSTSGFLEDKDAVPELPRRSIVTLLGARRLDQLEADILVRGDGSSWPSSRPARVMAGPPGSSSSTSTTAMAPPVAGSATTRVGAGRSSVSADDGNWTRSCRRPSRSGTMSGAVDSAFPVTRNRRETLRRQTIATGVRA